MEELTYDELRRIHAREKGPTVSALQPNFYQLAGKLLSTYDRSDPSGMREYNNVLKMLKYIYYRRLEKTVNASISSFKGVESPPEMLPRERELYERIVSLVRSDEKIVDADLLCKPGDEPCPPDSTPPVVETGEMFATVKIVKDVDEFVGLNGKTYGPYRANEEIELPPEEAESLVTMESAVRIQKKE
jgi:DNA replication initiation complex subunit (GINS family)